MSNKIIINSKNKEEGSVSDSNFNYIVDVKGYTKCTVTQVKIPKSYYLITSSMYFLLNEGGDDIEIKISPGNYSRTTFAAALATKLTELSPNTWTYTITFTKSPDDGIFHYTSDGNPSFTFVENYGYYEQCGFDIGTYTFSSNTLDSVNVVNMQLEDTLFIHSDLIQNEYDNILQEVYMSSNIDYSNIHYTPNFPYAMKLKSKESNKFYFYLADENGNIIDLNGQNMVITIVLFN